MIVFAINFRSACITAIVVFIFHSFLLSRRVDAYLDATPSKEDFLEAWATIRRDYQSQKYSSKVEHSSDVGGAVALSKSSKTQVTHIVGPSAIRIDGKLWATRPDATKIDRKLLKDTNQDFSSITKSTVQQVFSTISNYDYIASLDTTNRPKIGFLEKRMPGQNFPIDGEVYPGLMFNRRAIVFLDLIWEADKFESVGDDTKYLVVETIAKGNLCRLKLKQSQTQVESFLVLDGTKRWSIKTWECTASGKNGKFTFDETFEYQENQFHPIKVVHLSSAQESKINAKIKIDNSFSELSKSEYSLEDCRLTSFGLPEAEFGSERLSRWPWGIGFFLCICVIVCLVGGRHFWKKIFA
jgi:hypothetical protein